MKKHIKCELCNRPSSYKKYNKFLCSRCIDREDLRHRNVSKFLKNVRNM